MPKLALRPLLNVQPELATSPLSRALQGLVVLDDPEAAVTVSVCDPPGGDASLWGDIASISQVACGTYSPLLQQLSSNWDVEVALPALKLKGTQQHPLRIRMGGPILLLAHMPVTVIGGEEGEQVRDRFCIVNESGVTVLESDDLDGGAWLVKTALAEETDLRLRSSLGKAGKAMPSIQTMQGQLGAEELQEVLRRLRFWIVALQGAREANVLRLREALQRAFSPLPMDLDVAEFRAWDTRDLSAGTVRALCHELVLNRQIFTQPTVRLRAGGREETYTEASQKRAAKVLGCAASHSDLWCQLATSKEEGPWVILEDDAVLNESRPLAPLLRSALATFAAGQWDLLLLGCASTQQEQWGYQGPCTLGPVGDFIGFWGYVISKLGAQHALASVWGNPDERLGLRGDVDVECAQAAKGGGLRVLACVPHLVFHPQCGLDPSLPGTLSAWRHTCRPARYQYRTIQVSSDFEFDTTRDGADSGDGPIDMRLVRRLAARVADFRRAAAGGREGEADDVKDPSLTEFLVVHTRVAKRAEPSTDAKAVGMAVQGARVRGKVREVNGVEWLELQEERTAWMLVHGRSIGLGKLLDRVPSES